MAEIEPDALRWIDSKGLADVSGNGVHSDDVEPLYSAETIQEAIERKLNEMLEKTDQAGAHLFSEEQDDALAAFKEELKEVFSDE